MPVSDFPDAHAKDAPSKHDLGASKCPGGDEAHIAHMSINGDCPWCGSYDKSKWLKS